MNVKISSIALALLSFTSLTKLCAQSPGQLYALGVNMGIVSYQLTAVQNGKDLPYVQAAWNAMSSSLQSAAAAKKQIDASAGAAFLPDGNLSLSGVAQNVAKETPDNNLAWYQANIAKGVSQITKIRSDYSLQLAKGGPPNLAQAYALGVNLGIVEGQATSGNNDARGVISDTLENAKGQAQALGLDLGPLKTLQDQVFAKNTANGTNKFSLDDLHNGALALRASYQTLLK